MNVYDFDGTIYDGDSAVDFYFYCLRKRPQIAVYIFRQVLGVLRHAIGVIDTKRMKEEFFSFLPALKNSEAFAALFWETRQVKIKNWYLEQREERDVVISASPEFLLRPVCANLGIRVPIATRMSPDSGKIQGPNCKGAEKVLRFRECFPDGSIHRFYSDSLTDAPLAGLAEKAFLVRKDALLPWPEQ